jgi:hypothetical protein
MNRKSEWRKLGEGILTAILAIALIFAFAALVHHVAHSCPQGTIPGTQGWCK